MQLSLATLFSIFMSIIFGLVYVDYRKSSNPVIRNDAELIFRFLIAFVLIAIFSTMALINYLKETKRTEILFYLQIIAMSIGVIIVFFSSFWNFLILTLIMLGSIVLKFVDEKYFDVKLTLLVLVVPWIVLVMLIFYNLLIAATYLILNLLFQYGYQIRHKFKTDEFKEIFEVIAVN